MSEDKMSEDLEKMKLHSSDFADENIRKIAEMFPNCVTETQDSNGSLKFAIDYDELRQELSDHIVEGPQERYHLNWPGKREALLAANAPITKTLRPVRDESVEFDTTQNLFIEGDNLEALKLLQKSYLGKVKMIYIDPPYNRGSDLIYKDRFAESAEDFLLKSEQANSLGERLVSNRDANGRFHSDWLSMMYPRLKIARDFMSDDGIILISCDDNEVHNVKHLCNLVFGAENFINQFIWKKNSSGKTVRNEYPVNIDYLLLYSKSKHYKLENVFKPLAETTKSLYRHDDNDGRGKYRLYPLQKTKSPGPETTYDYTDLTGKLWPCPAKGWRMNKSKLRNLEEDGRLALEGKTPQEKAYWNERINEGQISDTLWDNLPENNVGTAELKKLFGEDIFDNPKPTKLIKRGLNLVNTSNELILDFFAGSGTTAHAVMQLNAEDGGNRQCISVQIPEKIDPNDKDQRAAYDFCVENNLEPNIAEISKERIRRAGAEILKGKCHPDWKKDPGFRVLKVDTSNMKDIYYRPDEIDQKDILSSVDNIKLGRTGEDMLFQVLVDWGVDLTLPIRHQKVEDKSVYFVDDDALIACFETGINEELVKKLATHKPLRVVFRDKGFASDDLKVNITQIFLQASPKTDVKVI